MYGTVVLALFAAVSLFGGSLEFDIEFGVDDISFYRYMNYDRISLPGCESYAAPGKPLLPVRVVTLVIPPDAADPELDLVLEETVPLEGSWKIQPAAVPRPFSAQDSPVVISPDPAVYSSCEPWPAARLEGPATGSKTGFKLVSFRYRPVTWNPSTGKLELATRGTVKVSWRSAEQDWLPTRGQVETAARLLGWVDNPRDVNRYAPVARNDGRATDYLVITSSDYSDAFSPYVSWKTSSGMPAELVKIGDILSSTPGYDDPEKLRNYILGRYRDDGVKYVLLAGDENVLPVRMVDLSCEGYSDNAPVDLYFSDMDGTWDDNGDHDYGQPADKLDLYADIAVGRALFDSSEEATVFIERSMRYQKDPPSGEWSQRAMLCGAGLFTGYTGAKVCDSIAARLPGSWEIDKAYELAMVDGYTTHIDVINSGTNWNHYAGHGNDTGIYWKDSPTDMMTVSIASDLENGEKTGIHHSIGCMPGSFHKNYDSCADALWHNPSGGAVSVMFNTSYGWEGDLPEMGVSEWMCVYLTEEVFRKGNGIIGNAFATSKDRRVPLWGGDYDRELYCILCWNAFHDPTLKVLGASTGLEPPPSGSAAPGAVLGTPWPNPVRGGSSVFIPVSGAGDSAVLSVYGLDGRLAWRTLVGPDGDVSWNTGGLPAGVYMVRLDAAGSCSSERIVVLP